MCETCGLPLPPESGRGPHRRYCTAICRVNRNRYPRAVATIAEIVTAAMRSEDLDRPELAAQEWKALDRSIARLDAMTARIRSEREQAGLGVPADWQGLLPVDVPIMLD